MRLEFVENCYLSLRSWDLCNAPTPLGAGFAWTANLIAPSRERSFDHNRPLQDPLAVEPRFQVAQLQYRRTLLA